MDLLDRLSSGWKAWIVLFALTFTAVAPGVFNIPAFDRDESRFAQASKQYIETGDYLVIRYQDEFRNKKPAGIHWLQSGATLALGDEDKLEIWTYRVPNWIGVSLATLATFWCGIALIGRRSAFIGAALFGTTLLLTSEGHISKTDGVLVFITTLGIGAIARLYMEKTTNPKRMALLFWFMVGVGLLIKGPVMPMVAAYAGLGAWVWSKTADGDGGDWWKPLAWWPGPLLALAMFLPWLIAIQFATDNTFLQGAVGKDLTDKFAGASEGHGGWPFYHLSHIPAWFFPAVLLLIPGIASTWALLRGSSEMGRKRGTDALLILFSLGALIAIAAWMLPGSLSNGAPSALPALILVGFWFLSTRSEWQTRWAGVSPLPQPSKDVRALRFVVAWAFLTMLFFELMPTSLSHYVLPAYPAMALLCGWGATRLLSGNAMPVSRGLSLLIFAIGGAFLLLLTFPGIVALIKQEAAEDFKTVAAETVMENWKRYADFPIWFWIPGAIAFLVSAIAFIWRKTGIAIVCSIAAGLFLGWHARISFLPTQIWIQPTESARLALQDVCGVPAETCEGGRISPQRILAIGYAEPSYVMSFGTQNLHPPETMVSLPSETEAYPVVYLLNLEDKASEPARTQLLSEAQNQNRCVTTSKPVYTLNYSNGEPVNFIAMRFEAEACPSY